MPFTIERFNEIIGEIHDGKALKSIFRSSGEKSAFYDHCASNADADTIYMRAQRVRAEVLADEIVDIADEETDPQRARNRIDARKWYASKMQPQKYGERLDLNVTTTVDIGGALAEAAKRALLPRRYQEDSIETQSSEIKQLNDNRATDRTSAAQDKTEDNHELPDIFG